MPPSCPSPDWPALLNAYCNGSWQQRFYFDRQSGQTHAVAEHTLLQLEQLYDDAGQLDERKLASDALRQAHAIEQNDLRYVKVPELSAQARLAVYDGFAATCERPLQRLLFSALNHGDLIRFETIVAMESAEKARWHQFQEAMLRSELTAWLQQLGSKRVED